MFGFCEGDGEGVGIGRDIGYRILMCLSSCPIFIFKTLRCNSFYYTRVMMLEQ